ncbi:hypothetical protein [Fonticella tunisiensis]|uniref:Uncharacterized protein n=1 Tax=Fonticella tunisiensis TaxID=1096341 RepID=A0A4R7KS22_9CLOT|nr:hypothetical protein [Fonticella tunisiensis]TDT62404.1 hypothetical protein EDD71_104129 [Fonticella tunisiensis]
MKRTLNIWLVVIITFITLVAIFTFRSDNPSYETLSIDDESQKEYEKPEGTGYIFDDFNRNLNIPMNNAGTGQNR